MNIRDSLVNIGDRFREICPTVWMDNVIKDSKNKIITDVRYPNEADIIYHNPRGLVIRVIRDEVKSETGSPAETPLLKFDQKISHQHEGPVYQKNIPYHYIIRNNGNIEDFKIKAQDDLLEFILSKWKYFV